MTSGPGGGCHKPSAEHRSTRRGGWKRKGGQDDEADCKLCVCEKVQVLQHRGLGKQSNVVSEDKFLSPAGQGSHVPTTSSHPVLVSTA